MNLLRHRHRYRILAFCAVQDSLTGCLYPCSRLLCRCGAEDPYTIRLRDIAGLKLR